MDTRKKAVIVQMLHWWLYTVYIMQNCFFICVARSLHSLQPEYDTDDNDAAFSDLPSTPRSDGTSVSKKRHRCHRDQEEAVAEVLREVSGNMERSIQLATEKLCTEIRRLAHEAAMDEKAERLFEDLLKVSDLTITELYEAHRKISKDNRMLVVFPTVPDHLKADWIRSLIQ